MSNKRGSTNRKKERRMAALATPKGSSYVVKKECISRIVESKSSASSEAKIKERAQQFKINNLDRK